MNKAKVSAKARADLVAIWLYVAEQDGAETADRVIDRLAESFPLLAAFPAMGKRREDVFPAARVFPVGSYLVFYRKRRRRRDFPHCAWRPGHPPGLSCSQSLAGMAPPAPDGQGDAPDMSLNPRAGRPVAKARRSREDRGFR